MSKTKIDDFTEEEVRTIVEKHTNLSQIAKELGFKSKCCYDTIRDWCQKHNISLEHLTGVAEDMVKRTPENTFIENSTAGQTVLRRLY